ncbi:MAG: HAMP domain-containing histidine kinase [Alphaproteobacteria bacterium]|nr:HAMP domain-containing histidine kinase [Alphaproteobacteria bacterium]
MFVPRTVIPRSVTTRLVVSYCLLLALLGTAFLGVTVLSFRYFTRQTIIENLAVRDHEIWTIAQEALHDPARLSDLIERRFAPEAQNRFIRIRVGETVIYQSGNPLSGHFEAAEVPWLNPVDAPRSQDVGNLLLYSRVYTAPGMGPISIATGQSTMIAHAVERRLFVLLLVGLPLLLVTAALAGYLLMRRALTPVEVMVRAAQAYTFDDPRQRLPLMGSEPRIAALGHALNRILDRLDGAYSHVSRFSADAAHELRTPLTMIRGDLEQIAAGQMTPDEAARALNAAAAELDRLGATVDSLIALSRLEGLWSRRRHGPVDLSALADAAVAGRTAEAQARAIALDRAASPPVMVTGDGEQLTQVIDRLLDNALKFTPEGGHVTVETGVEAGMAFVAVEDTGVGIDPRHHERVFDRFYRAGPRDGGPDKGPGLGLSIVRAVAQAHGGRASLRSVPDLGSIFRVDLPLAGQGAVPPDFSRQLPQVPWSGGL